VTLTHYDLVHRPRLTAVTRDELPLLDAAVDVDVVALLESLGDIGKLSVRTEAVPVREFPCVPAGIRASDALTTRTLATGVPEGRWRTSGFFES
jgi:hypothetical protein